ncbi:(ABC) transporter [Coemansia sp. RSA 1843]|nr:(ABC) transporter [Coemansia sp. RSA 1843]
MSPNRVDRPGQEVIERTSVVIDKDNIEARLTAALPASGRTIVAGLAKNMFLETLPLLVSRTLLYESVNAQTMKELVECVEDQEYLRSQLLSKGIIGFIGDGSILPRRNGISSLPLVAQNVVPFTSPASMRVSFVLPNRGEVTGMGIPQGITLISGGGFNGKSTLLQAIELGVYNHIPGDGRELVVTLLNATKIKSEEGRFISNTDIRPFINNLPFGRDTKQFATEDASGSTSMAASIQEALESGADALLYDEDTCATNFLVRDRRMQKLVSREHEPITPLVNRIREMWNVHKISSVLVIGGYYASIGSDGLSLSLVKSDAGYKGSTVYFTEWVQYGVITAQIRSGSTTPGVVSSLQLQDESGTSIDMDWVGSSPKSVQANYYVENQLELSQATTSSLTSDPTSSFITYKIVWLPDSLTWYANGFAVRTVNRRDTWAEGEQKFKYPSNASRLSFSIWNAADSPNADMTQQWAGSIPSTSTNTKFSMTVERVQIDCYSNTTGSAKSEDSPQSSDLSGSSFASTKSATEVDLSNFGLSSQDSANPSLSSTSSSPTEDYVNSGSQYDIIIQKLPMREDLEETTTSSEQGSKFGEDSLEQPNSSSDDIQQSNKAPISKSENPNPHIENAGFNLDNILDLMAGDESGNVDFGAIGIELANNLANVVDMNEVGSFATTLGLMMSGIGTAAEIQRLRGGASDSAAHQNNGIPNAALNNGISALIGQILATQQASAGGSDSNAGNQALNIDGIDMAKLLDSVAGGSADAGDIDINHIAGVVDSILGDDSAQRVTANAKANSISTSNSKKIGYGPSSSDNSNSGNAGTRSAASALNDFINGNDTSNISDIAQAIGIHCLLPACLSPVDEGKRPAAKNGHCHQDTECRPGWGGWNCNRAEAKETSINKQKLIGDTVANSEIDRLMMNTQRATVAFRNISYTIKPQEADLVSLKSSSTNTSSDVAPRSDDIHDQQNKPDVQVLKQISGVVHPGEILAILGASGAGKSTLLDILSRREKCGQVTGKVQVNDRDLISDITTNEFHRMSGYVDQQDLHVSTATVYEAVMTSALLRLPQIMSRVAKEERVQSVLKELGLWSVKDSRIGKNGARGISGGEMRRVSIACELVTSPSIIFLDEPTSGLDAYNAYVVMDTLSKLARSYGRTVVCTIHQPRTDIFSMFDKLIVLAAGQMCYSGPANAIGAYLKSIGHPVPEGYNIADFSIDLVQQATATTLGQSNRLVQQPKRDVQPGSDAETSDEEWSPLVKDSNVSLTDIPNNVVTNEKQFLVYNTNVDLNQILDSFRNSKQYENITKDLDSITGEDWTPSSFEMVTSIGSTPHMRPVTPLQQVKVIFMNLYDLVVLLYSQISGRYTLPSGHADKLRPSLFVQFKVLSARIFRHLYRDPTLMLANYVLSIFIGLMCGVLFYQLDSSMQGVQNRLGLLIFILAFYGFGCTTSLLVFSEERLLYLRERANAYYDPLAYFLAKVTFDLVPLRVVPPLLLTLIAYPMTGLAATWAQFIKFFSTLVLFNLTVASQMFFIGLLAEELVVSNFLASIMLLFSLLFGGLILNKESIPAILQPLTRFSSFNLAYEALAINELRHAHIEEVRFANQLKKNSGKSKLDERPAIVPVPDKLQAAKFVSHVGDKGEIFYNEDSEPLWLRAEVAGGDGVMLVPTVYTQWMFPTVLPVLYTISSVVEKLLGGADLMVPGLLVPEDGLPDLSKGTLVAICCPGNLAAQAIGVLTFDTKTVKSVAGAKGKAVLVTHTYKDYLWGSGSKKELPAITPDDIGCDQTANDVQTNPDENGTSNDISNNADISKDVQEAPAETTDDSAFISPTEMDELLFMTLKQVIATVLDQDSALLLLPIPTSTLYSTYMVPNAPIGKDVDIKKSSYKKLTKFLKAADKCGLIKLKDIRGESYVKSLGWDHKEIVQYTPYSVPLARSSTKGNAGQTKDNIASTKKEHSEASQGNKDKTNDVISIVELLKPSRALVPLFDDMNAQTETGFFTRKQARSVLEDYIKDRGLVDAKNSQFVKLDHRLCDGLLTKEEYSTVTIIRRDKLHTRLQETMTLYTQVTVPGKEAMLKIGNPPTVDIVCEKKMGNKVVTRVIGLEAYGVDPADIAKELKTICASSTTVDPVPGKKNAHSVLVQGHQVVAITKLLAMRCKLPQQLLTVVDKTGKSKKASKSKN